MCLRGIALSSFISHWLQLIDCSSFYLTYLLLLQYLSPSISSVPVTSCVCVWHTKTSPTLRLDHICARVCPRTYCQSTCPRFVSANVSRVWFVFKFSISLCQLSEIVPQISRKWSWKEPVVTNVNQVAPMSVNEQWCTNVQSVCCGSVPPALRLIHFQLAGSLQPTANTDSGVSRLAFMQTH